MAEKTNRALEAEKTASPKAEKPKQSNKVKRAARKAARKAAHVKECASNASLHYLRVTPRKVRLVADNVRGMRVGDALAMLKYTPQSAAKPLAKLLRSAVANAEQRGGHVDVDALFVKKLTVDQGPKMRRFMPRAQGRAFRVEKKTSHVYLELGIGARA